MVVAKALDFPGAVTQGFGIADARNIIAGAMEDLAQSYLEEGRALPVPDPQAADPKADLIELVPRWLSRSPCACRSPHAWVST